MLRTRRAFYCTGKRALIFVAYKDAIAKKSRQFASPHSRSSAHIVAALNAQTSFNILADLLSRLVLLADCAFRKTLLFIIRF